MSWAAVAPQICSLTSYSFASSLLTVAIHAEDFRAATVALEVDGLDIVFCLEILPAHGAAPVQRRIHDVGIAVAVAVVGRRQPGS